MLSSIHPFGERSRNNSFWLTAAAHTVGSLLGGMALGLVVGVVGVALIPIWPADSTWRAFVLAAIALGAASVEATGRERSFPTRTRQVNENWIQQYRGWVYGGGFGVELGFGISTIITTTLVHVMVAAMVLVGSLSGALIIGAAFGVVRGGIVTSSYRVDSPERLRELHRRLEDMRMVSRSVGLTALVLTGAIGMSAVML